MKIKSGIFLAIASFWVAPWAQASVPFSATSLSGLTNTYSEALLKTVALGADYRAYMPASALGMTLGFDVGVDVTLISPAQEFKDAYQAVAGSALPMSFIPLPRLSFHKGLPMGVDLGFSFLSLSASDYSIKMVGGEIKWAFISGGAALPAVAVKASAAYNGLGFINTHSYKLDVIASKNLFLLEPYLGAGIETWTGQLDFPISLGSLPVSVSGTASGTSPHFFAGALFKFLLLKTTIEMDYNTSGATTYGTKISLGF